VAGCLVNVPATTRQARVAFRATPEAEARLLLLIDAFSRKRNGQRTLEGRVKLAKLDFLLRYPAYAARLLAHAGAPQHDIDAVAQEANPLEQRMVRYRYGPWDPAYYALLGSLIGRGLVEVVPLARGFGYRTTARGQQLAVALVADDSHALVAQRTSLLRKWLDKQSSTLKNWVYDAIPEVSEAEWHTPL